MSIAKILKEQKEFLTNATKEIEKREVKAEDLNFPDRFKESREEDIKDRIDTLKKQKEETVRRYDRAIAEQEKELERLEKEISVPGLGELNEQRKNPARTGVTLKQTTTTAKETVKATATKKVKADVPAAKKETVAKKVKRPRKVKKKK